MLSEHNGGKEVKAKIKIKRLQEKRDKINKEIKQLKKIQKEEKKKDKIKYTHFVLLKGELIATPIDFIKKFDLINRNWGTDKKLENWTLNTFWSALSNSNIIHRYRGTIELLTKNAKFDKNIPLSEIPEVKFTLSHIRSKKNKNTWPKQKEMSMLKRKFEKMGFKCWFEVTELQQPLNNCLKDGGK